MKSDSSSMPAAAAARPSAAKATFLTERIDPLLRQYATHFTATLSLVVGVTGTMMFFHFYKNKVQGMHEWLGMAFLLAFVVHVLRNRRPFTALFSQTRTYVLLAVVALVAVLFLALTPAQRVSPSKALTPALLRAPLSSLAPALGISVGDAQARVAAVSRTAVVADSNLQAIATAANLDAVVLLNAVLGGDKAATKPKTD